MGIMGHDSEQGMTHACQKPKRNRCRFYGIDIHGTNGKLPYCLALGLLWFSVCLLLIQYYSVAWAFVGCRVA